MSVVMNRLKKYFKWSIFWWKPIKILHLWKSLSSYSDCLILNWTCANIYLELRNQFLEDIWAAIKNEFFKPKIMHLVTNLDNLSHFDQNEMVWNRALTQVKKKSAKYFKQMQLIKTKNRFVWSYKIVQDTKPSFT